MVLAVLAFCIGPARAWDEPDGFRNIPWGSPPSVVAEQLKGVDCYDKTSRGSPSCSTYVTIGDVRTFVYITFETGGMDRVGLTFPSDAFPRMKIIFVDRYGPPTSSRSETVQNRMGAKYENEILEWAGEKIDIALHRYGSKLTDSYARIETNESKQRRLEEAKKKLKEGKKDL
jgi:hypothetical protein